MRLTESVNGNHYQFDDVTIDYENFRVKKNGQPVALTPRAFDVLVFLFKNGGRVVEKQELFEQIWKDAFVSDNALTKIIKEIRQAINDNVNQPRYIETVPKRGYRFIAEIKNENGLTGQPDNVSQDISALLITAKSPTIPKHKNYLFLSTIVIGLLILAASIFLFRGIRSAEISENAPIDSIAVLPFENATQDENLEYLSDGITENIINTLSPLTNLRVIPRQAVFYYKNNSEDPRTIGRALNARAVLTGRVVRQGDTLIIQTDLIDVDKKAQIWGQQYVYQMSDLNQTQKDIAKDVVGNLRLKLSEPQQQQFTKKLTENSEAQNAYMSGLYFYNQAMSSPIPYNEKVSLCEKSIEQFEHATKLEPLYAQAFADLSRAYACLVNKDFAKYDPKAQEAVQTALRIDDTNATAHGVWAFMLWQRDWNWQAAEKEFQRTIELNPNASEERRRGYARLLSATGRHEEAIRQIETVESLDPITLLVKADVGYIYKDARQYDKALEKFRSLLEVQPKNDYARFGVAEILAYKGMFPEAIAEIQKLKESGETHEDFEMFLGWIYAMAGRRDEALKVLGKYQQNPRTSPVLIASTYTALNDKDKAFFWLDKAYTNRSSDFPYAIKVSPVFDKLRADPRYVELLHRINLEP